MIHDTCSIFTTAAQRAVTRSMLSILHWRNYILERIFVLSTFESKLNSNTSLAVQGALANRLQRRTDFKTQNGIRRLERGPTLGLWEIRTFFEKQDSWSEHSFYEKRRQQRKKKKEKNGENSGPLTSWPVGCLNGDWLQRLRACQNWTNLTPAPNW